MNAKLAANPRHRELGLSDEEVLAMYRQMLLARAVDERMWLMQRAGKIAFIISGQGHEGAQVGVTWPMRRNHDWMAPFYRSIAATMTFGMTAEDIITAHLAKADDVSSAGRQMPGHYGGAAYNIVSVSSPVGTQVLHAVGIAMGAWVRGEFGSAVTLARTAQEMEAAAGPPPVGLAERVLANVMSTVGELTGARA